MMAGQRLCGLGDRTAVQYRARDLGRHGGAMPTPEQTGDAVWGWGVGVYRHPPPLQKTRGWLVPRCFCGVAWVVFHRGVLCGVDEGRTRAYGCIYLGDAVGVSVPEMVKMLLCCCYVAVTWERYRW